MSSNTQQLDSQTDLPVSSHTGGPFNAQTDGSSTCQQCKKAIGNKCTAIIVCVSCSAHSHVGCLVNNFIVSNNGCALLRNSQQWLADFLHTESFHHVCSNCTDHGVNLAVEFPKLQRQSHYANTAGDFQDKYQHVPVMSKVDELQKQVSKICAQLTFINKTMRGI